MRRAFAPMLGAIAAGALSLGALLGPADMPARPADFIAPGGGRKGHGWDRSKKLKGYRRDHQRKRCHGRWK